MPKLYFVSSNDEKYREIRGALADCGLELERVALDLPEIQSLNPAEVAAYKARKAFEHLGNGAVLVEDTGLAVNAWNGFPGALIKWVLGSIGEAGLCRQLDAWTDRSATATVVLCLFDGHDLHTFTGQSTGVITPEPRLSGHLWRDAPRGQDENLDAGPRTGRFEKLPAVNRLTLFSFRGRFPPCAPAGSRRR
jgi:non-canonical purine NTP pyrophosphatase (RdgB/HAM1 family)